MTREATKKKRDKKRALKRKHEHLTEQMHEEHARKKRSHTEELIALIMIVVFATFMTTGMIWWPASTTNTKAEGGTGLPDGRYEATCLSSRPAAGSDSAVTVLDVHGESFFVDEDELSGEAAEDPTAFFSLQRGEQIEVTVKDGLVTDWTPVSAN